MTNTCRSETNQLEQFVFLTIYGSKSNNYSTLMQKTQIRRIKIHLITRKWLNIIKYLPECYLIFALIFALRSNTSTANHHFFASPTIRLRLQRFVIRLDIWYTGITGLANLFYLSLLWVEKWNVKSFDCVWIDWTLSIYRYVV